MHGKFLPPCSIEEIQRVQANVCKNKNYLCMHHHRILPLPFLPPSTGEGSMDVKVKTTLKVAHHGVIFFRFFALPARSSSVQSYIHESYTYIHESYMSFTGKIVIAKFSAKVMYSGKVTQFIHSTKSYVYHFFSINPMYSVNLVSVKVMLPCT